MHKSKLLAGLCLAALLTLPGLAKERREIPKGLTWDLEQIYASEDAWQAARQRVAARLPEMAPFQGHLAESLGPAQQIPGHSQRAGASQRLRLLPGRPGHA